MTETINIKLCDDCVMYIAGVLEDLDVAAEVEKGMKIEWDAGYDFELNCDPEVECDEFSWTPDDGCRRPLGGNRHPALLVKEEGK